MTELAVPRQSLISAARALAHAGRWQDAADLLDAAPAGDPQIALASAQAALESDWFAGTAAAAPRLATAARLAEGLDDAGRWDLAFAELRHAYRTLLTTARSASVPLTAAGVRWDAAALAATAPDAVRNGWAELYQGLTADNLLGDRAAGPAHYATALQAGDPLLAREALRHLGDHDHDHGDHHRALERWRRATELGAAAGNVPGTLSQQLLLAVLARDSGDEAGAVALATEVARWAAAIGATALAGQATAFVDGTDPTAPPPAARVETAPAPAPPRPAPATPAAPAPAAPPTPALPTGTDPAAGDATLRTSTDPAAGGATARTSAGGAGVEVVPLLVSFMTAPLATTPRQ